MFNEWQVPTPYKLVTERTSTGETVIRYVEPNPVDIESIRRSTRFVLERMDDYDRNAADLITVTGDRS
jgi:hypothetical protein